MEAEIRGRIRTEQDLQKRVQSAESRLETVQKDYAQMEKKYEEMMLKLSDMAYENDAISAQNESLKKAFEGNYFLKSGLKKGESTDKKAELEISKRKTTRNLSMNVPVSVKGDPFERKHKLLKSWLKRRENAIEHGARISLKGKRPPELTERPLGAFEQGVCSPGSKSPFQTRI